MTESPKSRSDVSLESSIPGGGASLESILCTEELQRRPWRPPDHKKENSALVALANALAESRLTILPTLAETILHVTESDSAGVSLLTPDDGGLRFYWPAIAGIWKPHIGGGTPRNFGPCGDVPDLNCTLLFRHFERRYPYLLPVMPPAEECLLVPFYVGGKAVGTIWAIMHTDRRKFDAEDVRLMSVLVEFASLAYQALASIDDLKLQMAAREKAETELRELTDGLEMQVRARTEELEQRNHQLAEARARLAEEKQYLEHGERSLRLLTETIPQMLWSATPDGAVDNCNQYVIDYTGLSAEQIQGAGWMKAVHPDDAGRMAEAWTSSVSSGSAFQFEFRGLHASDQTYRWCVSRALPLRDQAGRIVRWYGTVTDLEDWKRAQEGLRESEWELRQLIEGIPQLIW